MLSESEAIAASLMPENNGYIKLIEDNNNGEDVKKGTVINYRKYIDYNLEMAHEYVEPKSWCVMSISS